MSSRNFPDLATLPDTLPVFPLMGCLLLPGGRLPLNIFEPRYLAMLDDALKGSRLIGMIQPREEETVSEDGHRSPARLHPVGCAGRVIAFSETDDGRYLITLAGIIRFGIAEELAAAPGGYRLVRPDWAPWQADLARDGSGGEALIDRSRLVSLLKRFLSERNLSADWDAFKDAPEEALVTVLAMNCPFSPLEKQALLEAPDLAEQGRILMALLELACAEASGESRRH
ncbi:LON peptidase substrate-binding domain-containing protein [Radicibacter daui]|uniref:LON peptidase substrate-binding domain-containing protein n=1 Tax=Radicibacter daui TaxID=3064829 RepID=UPI004046B953